MTKDKDKGKGKKSGKNRQLVIRVQKEERDAFVECCEKLDTSASREIRQFMREFVAGHVTSAKSATPQVDPKPEKAASVKAAKPVAQHGTKVAPAVKKAASALPKPAKTASAKALTKVAAKPAARVVRKASAKPAVKTTAPPAIEKPDAPLA